MVPSFRPIILVGGRSLILLFRIVPPFCLVHKRHFRCFSYKSLVPSPCDFPFCIVFVTRKLVDVIGRGPHCIRCGLTGTIVFLAGLLCYMLRSSWFSPLPQRSLSYWADCWVQPCPTTIKCFTRSYWYWLLALT